MAVGVIGLGNIGGAIAANLVADGHDVVVYDLDASAMQAISGATAADDVKSVARRCGAPLLAAAHTGGRRRRGRILGREFGTWLRSRRFVHQ